MYIGQQMKKGFAGALLLSLLHTVSAFPHNLDEYLQAAVISLHPDEIHVSLRLVPGVAVLPELLKSLDTDADGSLSQAEKRAYTARVLNDISVQIDGSPITLQVQSADFPSIAAMKDGVAEIRLELGGRAPAGGENRTLVFENHHLTRISAYLANSLVPSEEGLRILAQRRNESQSRYELQYRQPGRVRGARQSRGSPRAAAELFLEQAFLLELQGRRGGDPVHFLVYVRGVRGLALAHPHQLVLLQ
jgi:hypothetical protein